MSFRQPIDFKILTWDGVYSSNWITLFFFDTAGTANERSAALAVPQPTLHGRKNCNLFSYGIKASITAELPIRRGPVTLLSIAQRRRPAL